MTLEKADYKHYLQFFAGLAEQDFIDLIKQIFEQRNSNLGNNRILQLKAPARLVTKTRKSYLICLCGHDYNAHALDEIWEDGSCRYYNCECQKFEG